MSSTSTRQSDSAPAPRRKPRQKRALERESLILDTAAELLDRVGIESLNTVLIAEEMGVSVGSLYQYFPNKHAILFRLSERWLDGIKADLDDIDSWPIESMSLETVVDQVVQGAYQSYRRQSGLLPLVRAFAAIPELRALEAEHDQLVINRSVVVFQRLGLPGDKRELTRIADVYLSLIHILMLTAVEHKGKQVQRTLDDAKSAIVNLLRSHGAE